MSEGSRRLTAGDSRQLVRRILDQPSMVAAVQSLPPRVLARVIGHVGLEDAGDVLALATTAQLAGIFDDDLWRSTSPGKDETFDADRFALWLEVMLEAGEAFAVQKLAELPEDFVTLAFHGQVLVINIEELAVSMSSRSSENPAAAALRSAIAAGKPWTARRNLEVLEERLEEPSLAALAALLGECPTLAGRLSPRGNAEFEFVSTHDQLGAVRTFLEGLGGVGARR